MILGHIENLYQQFPLLRKLLAISLQTLRQWVFRLNGQLINHHMVWVLPYVNEVVTGLSGIPIQVHWTPPSLTHLKSARAQELTASSVIMASVTPASPPTQNQSLNAGAQPSNLGANMRDLHIFTTDIEATKLELTDMNLCREEPENDNSWLETQVTTTPQQGHFRLRTTKARAMCIEQAAQYGMFNSLDVIPWPTITGQQIHDWQQADILAGLTLEAQRLADKLETTEEQNEVLVAEGLEPMDTADLEEALLKAMSTVNNFIPAKCDPEYAAQVFEDAQAVVEVGTSETTDEETGEVTIHPVNLTQIVPVLPRRSL